MDTVDAEEIRTFLSDWYEDYDPSGALYDEVVKAIEYEHKNAIKQEQFGRTMQKEAERLRSIEAAARALGPDSPYVFVDIVRHCSYCHGPRIIDEHMEQHWQHDPLCEWARFQAALGQGQAGERGGSGEDAI